MQTIYALATARGRAGVAVIRVSGPRAFVAVQMLCGDVPAPRHAVLRRLVWAGEELDRALVLLFPEGASFTGEAVAEFQVHGGLAVVDAVLRALSQMDGLRPAEAGEFTRRALENGCLDLAQVEGLGDLIAAETEAQRRQAQKVLSGRISARIEGWRLLLIRARALLEATIDFADEDVPVDVRPEVRQIITALLGELRSEMVGVSVAERLRDGFEVAIVGVPNSGKSTLLNALAGRDAALTSPVAGTTRDIIEVRMDIGGLPVTVLDTAGLRDTDDMVEALGVERARQRAAAADLRVFLVVPEGQVAGLEPGTGDIVLRGRCDENPGNGPGISGLTGEGVSELLAEIGSRLGARVSTVGVMSRERHRLALMRAVEGLESAQSVVETGADLAELAAEDLARASRALESILGRVDVEAWLGEIFSSFCIGK